MGVLGLRIDLVGLCTRDLLPASHREFEVDWLVGFVRGRLVVRVVVEVVVGEVWRAV
jgi:hypothetical protein